MNYNLYNELQFVINIYNSFIILNIFFLIEKENQDTNKIFLNILMQKRKT